MTMVMTFAPRSLSSVIFAFLVVFYSYSAHEVGVRCTMMKMRPPPPPYISPYDFNIQDNGQLQEPWPPIRPYFSNGPVEYDDVLDPELPVKEASIEYPSDLSTLIKQTKQGSTYEGDNFSSEDLNQDVNAEGRDSAPYLDTYIKDNSIKKIVTPNNAVRLNSNMGHFLQEPPKSSENSEDGYHRNVDTVDSQQESTTAVPDVTTRSRVVGQHLLPVLPTPPLIAYKYFVPPDGDVLKSHQPNLPLPPYSPHQLQYPGYGPNLVPLLWPLPIPLPQRSSETQDLKPVQGFLKDLCHSNMTECRKNLRFHLHLHISDQTLTKNDSTVDLVRKLILRVSKPLENSTQVLNDNSKEYLHRQTTEASAATSTANQTRSRSFSYVHSEIPTYRKDDTQLWSLSNFTHGSSLADSSAELKFDSENRQVSPLFHSFPSSDDSVTENPVKFDTLPSRTPIKSSVNSTPVGIGFNETWVRFKNQKTVTSPSSYLPPLNLSDSNRMWSIVRDDWYH